MEVQTLTHKSKRWTWWWSLRKSYKSMKKQRLDGKMTKVGFRTKSFAKSMWCMTILLIIGQK
jgi:hypothetical protein